MRLHLVAGFLLAALAISPAIAQDPEPPPPATTATPPQRPPLRIVQAPAPVPPAAPTPVQAPAATQNTITTTAPVSSETTISVGSLAGQALDWAFIAFGGVLTTFLTRLFIKLAAEAGVRITKGLSDQINEALLNGLNHGESELSAELQGKDPITIKNAIVASAVEYAQTHRADAIEKLGLNPQSGAAVQSLRARIATLVADPDKPTPAVLAPTPPPATAAEAAPTKG